VAFTGIETVSVPRDVTSPENVVPPDTEREFVMETDPEHDNPMSVPREVI
jgi:hypothetical protein